MTFPALRNMAYPGDPLDLDLYAMFSDERGQRVLAHLMERGTPVVFLVSEIRASMDRVQKHCGTGSLSPA